MDETIVSSLKEILGDFLKKSEAKAVCFVDEGGRPIVSVVRDEQVEKSIVKLSVLVAGSFYASKSLMESLNANLSFFSIEGEGGLTVFVRNMSGKLVFSIHSGDVQSAIVKLYINQLVKRLEKVMEGVEEFKPQEQRILVSDSVVSPRVGKKSESDPIDELRELLKGIVEDK